MKAVFIDELEFPTIAVETENDRAQESVNTTSYLVQEFELWKNLLYAQSKSSQDYLANQGRKLAETIFQHGSKARFTLPAEITLPAKGEHEDKELIFPIPVALREHNVGGFIGRLRGTNLVHELCKKFNELEDNIEPSIAAGAGLVRHATAVHIISSMVRSGDKVNYLAAPGEEIPNIPPTGDFYNPEWVSFDNEDNLRIASIQEAKINLASMRYFLQVLYTAVTLAPYFVVDPEYQQKRYGMLGQLVNQGRAFARYEMKEIIQVVQQRMAANNLNRGLNLELTYFDDQSLEIKSRQMDIIPSGKIMFHPAFIVLAARKERARVAQDTSLSLSTRKHLQAELMSLERAFNK